MTATRTAPKWLGDYIEELAELRFLPIDDAADMDLVPSWVADTSAYAVLSTEASGTIVLVTDNAGDERVTVTVLTTSGVLLHDPLSFGAHDLGFRLLFSVLETLAAA